jgi:hypothetical protein
MPDDNTVNLKVIIEGIGERVISFNMQQLVGHLKAEHFWLVCPLGPHSPEVAEDINFDCPKCRGTNFVLHPAGEVISNITKRQQMILIKDSIMDVDSMMDT